MSCPEAPAKRSCWLSDRPSSRLSSPPGDTTTTRTYTVTVTRAASSNAKLASLTPSVGALDPGFNPDSFDYAVAVANAVESIALTPTAADANATITVNGQSVTSGGVSQAIALPVGSTAISVVVTAGDGTTTRTYTVTAMRAQPVPTVVSREIEINAGETASVDLTQGATGGPFTDAAIVDLSDADAGSARIERDGQIYRLVFASNSTYAGGADVRFTLSNATGMSAPGTIAFTIVGRQPALCLGNRRLRQRQPVGPSAIRFADGGIRIP